MIGKILNDRYELISKIGSGGMADVYLAKDKLMNREVAIKLLSKKYATDDSAIERFVREARSAGGLTHKNIVSVHDLGEHEDLLFIVMEYVEGQPLSDLIKNGPIQPERVKEIAKELASALGWAHRNGIVHRDVKSGNIIINSEGISKITDFGIAMADQDHSLTKTGSVLGTATHFSPEQACGEKGDPRSDLYSLGVVMYEMLAGSLPFDGATAVSIAYKHVEEAPPKFDPSLEIPTFLSNIVYKLLAKDPSKRFQTAEELLHSLSDDNVDLISTANSPLVVVEDDDSEDRDKGFGLFLVPRKVLDKFGLSSIVVGALSIVLIGSFVLLTWDNPEKVETIETANKENSITVPDAPTIPDLLESTSIPNTDGTLLDSTLSESLVESDTEETTTTRIVDPVGAEVTDSNESQLEYVVSQTKLPIGDCLPYDNVNTFSTVMNTALEQIGKPYQQDIEVTWLDDPKAFDSGEFVDWAFSNAGIWIGDTPRESFNMMNKCEYNIGVKWGMKRAGTVMFAFEDVDPNSNTGRMAISLGTGNHVVEATKDEGVVIVKIDDPTSEFSKAQFIEELGAGSVELN